MLNLFDNLLGSLVYEEMGKEYYMSKGLPRRLQNIDDDPTFCHPSSD
jgi:hypothetical protein